MDWIRRNWPDLIIGLALLAVIAGIIATLLSGGSFLPGSSSGTTVSNTTSTPSVAETPSAASEDTAAEDAVSGSTTVITTQADTETATGTSAVGEASGDSATTQDAQGDITPIVPGGETTDAGEGVSTGNVAGTTDVAVGAETTAPVELGETSPDLPYRISVGSYRDTANAERRAESFAAAGYPTFIGAQEDLSIVLVGPYGTRAEAETAVAAIQRDGLEAEPLLFEFSEETDQGSIVSVPAETVTTEADEAASAATSSTPLATTEGGSYLQAGAYNNSESAQPQRERLEGLGLSVTELQEGSFIKLLAGPFADDELGEARATLDAQGIDYFVRGN